MDKNKILELCSFLLDFGKVERITCHQDGKTRESDTDHTVMISVLACAIAKKLYNDLDVGLIAQFALVHDLVEVYAGDTPTLVEANENFIRQKDDREKISKQKIESRFSFEFPWIFKTITKYEELDTKEALFVKCIDRIVPKITVYLNKAKYLNDNKIATRQQAKETYDKQRIQMNLWAKEFPELLEIWEYFVDEELKLLKN